MANQHIAMEDPDDRFLHLLNRISQRANNDHIKTARFLLRAKITRKQMEQCNDMKDLFEKLITRSYIGPDNIELLKDLTEKVFNDCEVDKMIQQYERGETNSKPQHASRSSRTNAASMSITSIGSRVSSVAEDTKIPAKFRQIFDHAAKHLGDDWKVLARLMGMLDHDIENISLKFEGHYERSKKIMEIWFGQQPRASSREFKKLLRSIPRNDIADDLQALTSNN